MLRLSSRWNPDASARVGSCMRTALGTRDRRASALNTIRKTVRRSLSILFLLTRTTRNKHCRDVHFDFWDTYIPTSQETRITR